MNKIAQSLRIPSSDGPSITECHEAANEIERLENLLATLDFYRDAYEKHLARGEALEKDNTRLYEQEALHTESYGIVCAERDRAVKALSDSVTQARRDIQPMLDVQDARIQELERRHDTTMESLSAVARDRDAWCATCREVEDERDQLRTYAEQLKQERDDLKADYLRRHNDAADRYEAMQVVRGLLLAHRKMVRNPGLTEPDIDVCAACGRHEGHGPVCTVGASLAALDAALSKNTTEAACKGGKCPEPMHCQADGECHWDKWNPPKAVLGVGNAKLPDEIELVVGRYGAACVALGTARGDCRPQARVMDEAAEEVRRTLLRWIDRTAVHSQVNSDTARLDWLAQQQGNLFTPATSSSGLWAWFGNDARAFTALGLRALIDDAMRKDAVLVEGGDK